MLAQVAAPVLAPVPATPRLARLGDLIAAWETEATAAYRARTEGRPRGPVTGLPALDRELGGALTPGLHIPHAGPGAGKTALVLQIAATCGAPALFVSCEMAPLELFRRHMARVSGTFLGRLKSGELVPGQALSLARQAVAAAPDLALADATCVFAAPAWLRAAAEATRGDAPHLLLVIDSLHAWVDGMPGDAPEYERLNAGIDALRALAATLDCPILAVAERNRASMAAGGLSAGAGTRKLEYAAESVWDLSREKGRDGQELPPDPTGEVTVTLRLLKNRHGTPGRPLPLKFHGALQRFREAEAWR